MSAPAWRRTSALIARTKRANPDADVTELLRRLKAERFEEQLLALLASDLSPTLVQRRHLADLLVPGGRA